VELNAALDAGMTVNEVKEVLVHLYAYCGFPRSIRGLQTFMAVLDERKANGKTDETGRTAASITDTRSRYERGKEIQMKVTGRTEEQLRTGYAAFSPEIEAFLKEHLFADLFERDLLSFQDREIVTIAALISMGGVEPMLQGHFSAGLTVGLTPGQLKQIVAEFDAMPDKKDAAAARVVLNQVLEKQ
jgi:alkylhydroperoxidase/carboxymuconolactone decarboxylase family protein YurZ